MWRVVGRLWKPAFFMFSLMSLLVLLRITSPVKAASSLDRKNASAPAVSLTAPPAVDLLSPLGPYGGRILQIAVQGTDAYVHTGYELQTIDLSDPADLQVVNRQLMPEIYLNVSQLLVDSQYLFLAVPDFVDEVRIYDISQPAAPQYVGTWSHQDNVLANFGLAFSDQHLFVPLADGIHVLGVTNPTTLVEVSEFSFPGTNQANEIDIVGDYAYVPLPDDGIHILDISNVNAISEVGASETPSTIYMGIEKSHSVNDLAVKGDFIYAAAGTVGVQVLDISDPTSPVEVALDNTILEAEKIVAVDNYSLVYSLYGMYLLDISNPVSPTQIAISPGWDQYHVNDMLAIGNTVYLSDGDFFILNLSNIPLQISGSLKSEWDVHHVEIRGDTAFMASYAELYSVDVSNPSQIQPQDVYTPPTRLSDFALAGDYAYIAAAADGLRVVDITNPASLTEVADLPLAGSANGITVANNYAFILSGSDIEKMTDINLVDISTPTNPQFVNVFHSPADIGQIAVHQQYLYVSTLATSGDKFLILDISQPNNIQQVGALSEDYRNVEVYEDFLYLTNDDGNLSKFDLTDPTQPMVVWTVNPVGDTIQSIRFSGSDLYLCTAFNDFASTPPGLQGYDLSTNPPRVTWRFDHPCNDSGVKDDTVYLLTGQAIYLLQYVPGQPYFLPLMTK